MKDKSYTNNSIPVEVKFNREDFRTMEALVGSVSKQLLTKLDGLGYHPERDKVETVKIMRTTAKYLLMKGHGECESTN